VLQVTFKDEVSQDTGGIAREFYTTIFKEVFSEGLGLFEIASTEEHSYRVAEDSCLTQGYT